MLSRLDKAICVIATTTTVPSVSNVDSYKHNLAIRAGSVSNKTQKNELGGADVKRLRVGDDFDSILKSFCRSNKVTIVAEGIPLHPILDAKQCAELEKKLPDGTRDPVVPSITEISRVFDYDAYNVDNHTILLQKRYRDPEDLPFVTIGEIKRSIDEILTITDAYAPVPADSMMSPTLFSFYDSLTTEQKARARDGLTWADMSGDQRSFALSAARRAVVDNNFNILREVLAHLKMLPNPHVVFTWMSLIGGDAFGYQGPFRANGSIRQFPLNNGFTCSVGGSYRRTTIAPSSNSSAAPSPSSVVHSYDSRGGEVRQVEVLDQSAPTELDRRLSAGMLSGRLPSTLTLGELADNLSKSTSLHVTVEPLIAEKPICLFGIDNSTKDQIVRDAAAVYGLRITSADKNSYGITMPRPKTIDDPKDAGAEMTRLAPAPLLAYYHGQVEQTIQDSPVATIPAGVSESVMKQQEAFHRLGNRYEAEAFAGKSLYFPAARRLLILALAAVPKKESMPLPVASLGPEASRLISFIMLSGVGLNQLSAVGKFVPKTCLMNPETLIIRIKEVKPLGIQQIDMRFGHNDANGAFVMDGSNGVSRKATDDPSQ